MISTRTTIAAVLGLLVALSHHDAASETGSSRVLKVVRVPVVGCPSDGQMGPVGPPPEGEQEIQLDPAIARRVALYRGEYTPTVLAPLGWNCLGLYGSNGSVLFIAPDRFVMNSSLEPTQAGQVGFASAAIQVTSRYAGTSGRFDVAQLIARVFPAYRAFIRPMMQPGVASGGFPTGPYPRDRLVRKGSRIVEYETPARSKGLGTDSYLLPNEVAIRGVAVIQGSHEEPDTVFLAMRLPRGAHDLAPTIVRHIERAATRSVQ